jgi:L-threonylcarbamoyladenylate synthase
LKRWSCRIRSIVEQNASEICYAGHTLQRVVKPISILSSLEALNILLEGKIVALPTETVYGLAADATRDTAVASIYQMKHRPMFNPLIVHLAAREHASHYAHLSAYANRFIEHFWHDSNHTQPLTLVLPLVHPHTLSSVGLGGLSTVALRYPTHSVTRSILTQLPWPLMMPSANRSQALSPTHAVGVLKTLDVPVVDGGNCGVGIESTIIDLTSSPPILLRKGAVLKSTCERILGCAIADTPLHSGIVRAPGMMKRHYAPTLPLRLDAVAPLEGEAWVAFGRSPVTTPFQLSECGDLIEAASKLFRVLQDADDPDRYQSIAVMPIPDVGIGSAIRERLMRGSALESSELSNLE